MSEYLLEMNNITKIFPGVKALDNVRFNLKKAKSMLSWAKMVPGNPLLSRCSRGCTSRMAVKSFSTEKA